MAYRKLFFAGQLFLLCEVLMRKNPILPSLFTFVAASSLLLTGLINGSNAALATSPLSSQPPSHMRQPWPEAEVIVARPFLTLQDEIATLEAVQVALSEVGDGSSYVWHRRNGRLSGIIKPTMSFRDSDGLVCRHLILWLTTGSSTKKTEGIACRGNNRIWSLGG